MKSQNTYVLTIILTFFSILFFIKCQHDDNIIERSSFNSGVKVTKITFQNLISKPNALIKLNEFNVKGVENIKKSIHNKDYNFTVDTSEILLIEKGDYHLITFPIYRDTVSTLTENLIFKSDSLGNYDAFLAQYAFDAQDFKNLADGKSISNFKDKTTIKYLPGIDSALYKSGTPIISILWNCEWIEVETEDGFAEHGNGYTRGGTVWIPINCVGNILYISGGGQEPLQFTDPGYGGNSGGGGNSGSGPGYGTTPQPHPGDPVPDDPDGHIIPAITDLFQQPLILMPVKPNLSTVDIFYNDLENYEKVFWNDVKNREIVDKIIEYLENIFPGDDEALEFAENWLALEMLLNEDPTALLEVPCSEVEKWLSLVQFSPPQSVKNKINSLDESNFGDYNIQYITHAKGAIANMDYFPVEISVLPTNPSTGQQYTPSQFLHHIRKNLNSFVDTSLCSFSPSQITGYNESQIWNSDNPVGAIIHININASAGDGSVICSESTTSKWKFTTIEVPWDLSDGYDGIHPVSGTREFGLIQNPNGSYTFYTRGVDRITDGFESTLAENSTMWMDAFEEADALWNSLRSKVHNYVQMNNGTVQPLNSTPNKIFRPDWNSVRRVLKGEIPISELGCD